jgi:predicted transcriptional regulator
MKKQNLSVLNLSLNQNKKDIYTIAKALSSSVRLDILEAINSRPLSVMEIADLLGQPISSTALHIKILREAGLIAVETAAGKHGIQKICSPFVKRIDLSLMNRSIQGDYNVFTYNIPIGSYSDIKALAKPTCGLASETEIIEQADNPSSFFSPRKTEAQIIWFSHGELTYKIPNYFLENNTAKEITFSLEICSEAPFYNLNYPSDITFYINAIELTTITAEADYGGRRGKLTPDWWNEKLTQFGKLKEITANDSGIYVNNRIVNSDITISDLKLSNPPCIVFRFGIKDDAPHKGGLNIFGERFGDFPQNIILKIKCT